MLVRSRSDCRPRLDVGGLGAEHKASTELVVEVADFDDRLASGMHVRGEPSLLPVVVVDVAATAGDQLGDIEAS